MPNWVESALAAEPVVAPVPTTAAILRRHFFRRFFSNAAASTESSAEASVIRALCAVAIPGLMYAFWLMPHYPGRPVWAVAADRYFFMLYAFAAMGAVTTFEWEMLFPDRADFLILLPLPLRRFDLFLAKGKALLSFLGLFLLGANIFGVFAFPAVSTGRHDSFFHAVWAHFVAVTLCGVFASFAVLAVEGLSLCVLPVAWFRYVSPVLQASLIAGFLLSFLLLPLVSAQLQNVLEGRTNFAAYFPPLWFLGLDERLLYGTGAPAASASLGAVGLIATGVAVVAAVLVYPMAWARQRKRALEGAPAAGRESGKLAVAVLYRTLLRRPQSRAIFHFLTNTIARNHQYQVYLAVYAGVGLALSLCTVITIRVTPEKLLEPALSISGLHAVLPLLLFWLVFGLKTAFGFPVELAARWVFPISLRQPANEVFPGMSAKAAKTWIQICCCLLAAVIVCLLLGLHWSWWGLGVQAEVGICLSILLPDVFFLGRTQIPFTRIRPSGGSGLPMLFVGYGVFFPALLLSIVEWETAAEKKPVDALWMALCALGAYWVLQLIDRLTRRGILGGFPEDEEDMGPQVLGLSR